MDSTKLKIPGSSLPVPSVQQLAQEPILTVPCRYRRLDLDLPATSTNTKLPLVPVIDMQKLLKAETADEELELLHSACKDWGFFQLINHGINTSVIESMKLEARHLFSMPPEKKKFLKQRGGGQEGFGQLFVVSEEQKLDWCDAFFLINNPIDLWNPYYFEHLPPSYKEALETYGLELQKVALTLLRLMARALKMDVVEMEELFDDMSQAFRVNYYPPCPEPEHVIGINSHSDAGGLTLLIQANDTQGLEVKKDGKWVPIKPLPNAIVANIGGILEIVSNGVYTSNLHRATVNSEQERISVVAFHGPRREKEFGPARSLINREHPPLFKRIKVESYFKEFFSRELKDKYVIDYMKI